MILTNIKSIIMIAFLFGCAGNTNKSKSPVPSVIKIVCDIPDTHCYDVVCSTIQDQKEFGECIDKCIEEKCYEDIEL